MRVKVNGVDVFHPSTGEVRSDGSDGIACWFIDTDYNEESFFVRHAYFLGANDPYKSLKTTSRPRSMRMPELPLIKRYLPAFRRTQVRAYCGEDHQSPW